MRRDELSLPESPKNDRPNDRWMCGRTADQTPCTHGPGRFGICPMADACRPRRTWHGRRKQIATFAVAIMAIALGILSQQFYRAEAFKPGPLATPHAQILSSQMTSDRCAACHPPSATRPFHWFANDSPNHPEITQTDLCLDCHQSMMDRTRATLAHNLPKSTRNSLRLASSAEREASWHDWLPATDIDHEQVQCSACHREHHGSASSLSAVSDHQCQTCHTDRFGSFATSHPDWDRWPYGRQRSIGFDHATHMRKHFPATMDGNSPAQFQCADCHGRTANGELTRVTTYERGCQSCHEKGMKSQIADGVELFALPSISSDAAQSVGGWPFGATGFYDGQIGPIAELLLRSDPPTDASLRELPGRDFSRIAVDDPESSAAALQIAGAYRQLLQEIHDGGQATLIKRLSEIGISHASAATLFRLLPTQLIGDAANIWFADRNQIGTSAYRRFSAPTLANPDDDLLIGNDHLLSDDALLSDDPSNSSLLGNQSLLDDHAATGDPLALDPLDRSADTGSTDDSMPRRRFDAEKMLPVGGWFRDDLTLSIRYRGATHADPVLKSVVEIMSELPPSDPLHQRLRATPAVAACVTCHVAAATSTGAWNSGPLIGRRREFTKFSHGPHLNIAGLADCQHCHAIARDRDRVESQLAATRNDPHDFESIDRQTCAGCHTRAAAGDACINCHRYHIDLR